MEQHDPEQGQNTPKKGVSQRSRRPKRCSRVPFVLWQDLCPPWKFTLKLRRNLWKACTLVENCCRPFSCFFGRPLLRMTASPSLWHFLREVLGSYAGYDDQEIGNSHRSQECPNTTAVQTISQQYPPTTTLVSCQGKRWRQDLATISATGGLQHLDFRRPNRQQIQLRPA